MFGVGFSELLLIGVVALIVIGPERLPKVARTAGLLLGRMQRYVATVKADIAQEIQLEELHRASAALKESMQTTRQDIGSAISDLHQTIHTGRSAENMEASDTLFPVNSTAVDGDAEESRQIELPLETPVNASANAEAPTVTRSSAGESPGHTDKASPHA